MKSYPLSSRQKDVWSAYKNDPENPAYNAGFAVRFYSELTPKIIRDALQMLINRHDCLRGFFSTLDSGETVQNIKDISEVYFKEIDASAWSEAKLKTEAQARLYNPFDLELGPLMRAFLFRRSETDNILLLSVHHIIVDAWSLWMISYELYKILLAAKLGNKVDFSPIQSSYADFVEWQEQTLNGEKGEAHWIYWKKQLLGGFPKLKLPVDAPKPATRNFNGDSYYFKLSQKLSRQIRALVKAEKTTLYTVLMAAFQLLLRYYSGQEKFLISSPFSARPKPDFHNTFGFFINLVLIGADFSLDPTFKSLVVQVRQSVVEAMKHQDYPLPVLIKRSEEELNYLPDTQTKFTLQRSQLREMLNLLRQDVPDEDLEKAEIKVEHFELKSNEGLCALALEMMETQDGLSSVFRYDADIFCLETIADMANNFSTLLKHIVYNAYSGW